MLGAGGRSSRMGQPKHLLTVQGRNLLTWQLERFQQAGGRHAVVVLPAADTTSARDTRVEGLQLDWVTQSDPAAPMVDSLQRAALRVLETGSTAACWLPVDTPAPDPAGWTGLMECLTGEILAVLPRGGGHPVLLGRTTLEMVADADPGLRLDHWLAAREAEGLVARTRLDDPARRLNLNTPGIWQDWLRTMESPRDGS
jgi:CTP:molybdopterin cytidylyltransferase MocA